MKNACMVSLPKMMMHTYANLGNCAKNRRWYMLRILTEAAVACIDQFKGGVHHSK